MSEAAEENTEQTPGEEPLPDETPPPEIEQVPAPRKSGHMSKQEWEDSGKDPADYVSEEVFEIKGSFLKQISKLSRKIDTQAAEHAASLDSQNKLHGIALTNRIKALEAERDEAIDLADRPTANQKQQEIDDNRAVSDALKEADTPAAPVAHEKAPEQEAWENDNKWIFDTSDPRANHAKALFSKIAQSGEVNSYPELFVKLDAEMAKAFPETPTSKRVHRTAEKGSPHGKPKAAALNTNDINAEEGAYFYNHGNQVVPGGDNVTLAGGKVIKGVDKAAMMKMIEQARTE